VQEQQSLDEAFPEETVEQTEDYPDNSDSSPPLSTDERVVESDGEETGEWEPRFSGSNRQDQFQGNIDDWDPSLYLASTSDFDLVDPRQRGDHNAGDNRLFDQVDNRIIAKPIYTDNAEGGDATTQLQFALDDLRARLERTLREHSDDELLIARVLSVAGTTLSAGYLAWLLRAAPIVASMAATLPAWSRFDPLPVLLTRNDEEEADLLEAEDSDTGKNKEDTAERLFDARSGLDSSVPVQDA
jgi:hypothetical protein